MSYRRMTLVERMDIFRLLYVERLKPSAIAAALNRAPSSITRELEKGMDNGMYNPILAETRHLEERRNQRPRLKMTDEAWNIVKPQLEQRWSPEEVAQCGRVDNIIAEMEQQIEVLKQYKTSLITETVTKGLDKTASMKDSGIDWIGKIPEHWGVGRIKDSMTLQRGYDLAQDDFIEGKIPVYGSNGIVGYHNKITTKGPNITIGRSGSVGEVNYIETDFWAHNTSIYVDDMKKNSCRYLFYVLLSIDIKALGNGSAVPTLDRKDVQNIRFVFTRILAEQQAIAAFLDKKCEDIAGIIADKRQSIEIMRAYKKSLIYEYVTGKKRVKIT
ncbi:MAG: hypothetical protein Pg6C_05540 [Treponemataceae bacterium]|nr:MAG: hypothetical protein Pg6C_05540 [Treponemataceae bacterium]